MNDKYARRSVAELINGYFLPSPTKPGGEAAEFARAKAECIAAQRHRIEIAESLTLDELKDAVDFARAERAAGM